MSTALPIRVALERLLLAIDDRNTVDAQTREAAVLDAIAAVEEDSNPSTLEAHLQKQATIVLNELRAARELANRLDSDPKLVTPHYIQQLRCLYLGEPLGVTDGST